MFITVDYEVSDRVWIRTRGEYTPHSETSGDYEYEKDNVEIVVDVAPSGKTAHKTTHELAALFDDDIAVAADCEYRYQLSQMLGR